MMAALQTQPRVVTMFAAGHLAPLANPCKLGHIGPYTPRPDLTAWRDGNPLGLPQVDCLGCRSSITDPRVGGVQ